ncbi:hypothetical protein OESDEN_12644 [Oesophagostomum dentatum]|uniref:Uncharacterized protein n=1 Tax=Oesophagostomum dentatum TaxID=61180 RepID=A0A0B1SUL9_OESDE|nr:hypothetical protein OESDEN_12644 [Oesophagostomum dentatum]
MFSRLLLCIITVSIINVDCFKELVVRRKYKSKSANEAIYGKTSCFEFPYKCGRIEKFPEIVYRIRRESCRSIPLFTDYVKEDFQLLGELVRRNSNRRRPIRARRNF